jgi:hypothetical protein
MPCGQGHGFASGIASWLRLRRADAVAGRNATGLTWLLIRLPIALVGLDGPDWVWSPARACTQTDAVFIWCKRSRRSGSDITR